MRILIVSSDATSQPHGSIIRALTEYLPDYGVTIWNGVYNICEFDVIYFLNVMDVIKHSYIIPDDIPCCASIRSHRAIQEYPEELKKVLDEISAVSADNKRLIDQIEHPKKFVTPHAPTSDLFKQTTPVYEGKKLVAGYVGSFRKDKRYDIFEKAIKNLKGKVIPKTVGKVSEKIAYSKMGEYYNSIDVLVCCSSQEGGPTPPLEAALCGRSTITTEVGFMQKAFNSHVTYFDETHEDLTKKLLFLSNHRDLCKKLGENAKNQIKTYWNWERLIINYKKMFDYCHVSG